MHRSLIFFFMWLAVTAADAATKEWVGGTGTSFATADNWIDPPDNDPTAPPGPGDSANFTGAGGLVTFPVDIINANTLITTTVEFQLLTKTYTTEIAVTNDGEVTVRNGVISANNPVMNTGGEMIVESDASLSVLDELLIASGGRLNVKGGSVDTVDVTVGTSPTTAHLIMNGGTLTSTNPIRLGEGGRALMSLFNGATLNAPSIVFGSSAGGRGDLSVGANTNLTLSGMTTVGEFAAGSIGVDGGTLTLDRVEFGKGGSGGLGISDGATVIVQNGDVELGVNPGVSGSITMSGGSLTLPANLFVGADGDGRIRTDGGTVDIGGNLYIGSTATGTGNWDLDANETTVINVTQNIIVGSRGIFLNGPGGSGKIAGEIDAETTISANAFIVGDGDLGLVFFDEFEQGALQFNTSIIGNTHNGVMNINGGTWDTTGDVTIGLGDFGGVSEPQGSVSLFNTVVTSASLRLGLLPGSEGELDMSGGSWQIDNGATVGGDGDGSVSLYDGATMTAALDVVLANSLLGSTGTYRISGAGSALEVTTAGQGVRIGQGGNGTMVVEEGGRLDAPLLRIAEGFGSTGSLIASGNGTVVDITGEIRLDAAGNGTLGIFDGAVVDSAFGTIESNGLGFGPNVTVSGAGSLWSMIELVVAENTTTPGMLIQGGGRVSCSDCSLALNPGSRGDVELTDANSRLDVAAKLFVGGGANGPGGEASLVIRNSAVGDVTGDTTVFADARIEVTQAGRFFTDTLVVDGGSVVVHDADSFAGITGHFALNSRLEVFDGARLDAGSLAVANAAADPSEIQVDGSGSILNVPGEFTFSAAGDGTLAVSGGAQVFSGRTIVDNGVGTFAVNTSVLGADTLWRADRLIVGTNSVHGGAHIADGGRLFCDFECVVGQAAQAAGTVTVTGADSTFDSTNAPIIVGESGTGHVQADNGARIGSAGGAVGVDPGSLGTVDLSGPTTAWVSTEEVTIGFDGAGPGGGTVRLIDGGEIAAPVVTVNTTGELFGSGTIFGELDNRGFVGPGFAGLPSTLFVADSYTQDGTGEFGLEIGGPLPGDEFGVAEVGGNVTLAGHLGVSLINGYVPDLNDSFVFITAAAVNGEFATALLPDLPGPLEFFIVYGNDFVSLAVIDPTPIPLPSPLVLLLCGLGAMGLTRRQRAGRVSSTYPGAGKRSQAA